jgi:hypothetical protein
MSIPREGHQFNRHDALAANQERTKSSTFMAYDGQKISRLDSRQHNMSRIGWGPGTYPNNNTVGQGGVILIVG